MKKKKKSDYQGIDVHNPKVGEAERVYYKKSISPPVKASQIKILDISQCSQELEDLNLESNKRVLARSRYKYNEIRDVTEKLPTLRSISNQLFVASDSPKSTSMQVNSSQTNSQTSKTMEMQQKLIPENSQTSIFSLGDFLVKHSLLLEKEKGLKIRGEHYFTKLLESYKLKDLNIFSLKMLKDCYHTIEGEPLPPSSLHFQSWGMLYNGWFLTASFLEFPRTEKGCSLSEVLEENPSQKYYLSEKSIKTIMSRVKDKYHLPSLALIGKDGGGGRQMIIRQTQKKLKQINSGVGDAQRVFDTEGIAPTLKGLGGGQGAKTGLYAVKQIGTRLDSNSGTQPFQQDRVYDLDGISPALQRGLPGGSHKIKKEMKIRRLTPIECERLQGFPDNWTEGFSDTQRYKMMGNAVTVNVIKAIIGRMFK